MRNLNLLFSLLCYSLTCFSRQKDAVAFELSLADAATHIVHVRMKCMNNGKDSIVFKMPQWTPGYYQVMNYANHVINFEARSGGDPAAFKKANSNTWVVSTRFKKDILVSYDVVADSPFVATSFMDTTHAYLTPAATFLYIDNAITTPVSVTVRPYQNWNTVATGLDAVSSLVFTAPDFDVLFDCPILAGNLEELPAFKVNGIQHRFIGYKIGNFDKVAFMEDLKRIVEASVSIMHDIPYKQYTFLGIGPGNGGIEHLTSSANSFDGNTLNTAAGRKRMLTFLAHEYFHNYNVKRVRPIELGPFDYDNGSKTNQLWISEGWTVYYEYLVAKKAAIIDDSDLYSSLRKDILAYEKHAGKTKQSLAQSSAETWSDGPFGNDPDLTISYYNKGPIVALMLDFAVRHHTNNQRSLDDILRKLYNDFYKRGNRGFTEAAFKATAESVAGTNLDEIFSYVYSTAPLAYNKYFDYAGLDIDTKDSSFVIKPVEHPDALQQKILRSWLGE